MIIAYLSSNPHFNIWNISYITSHMKWFDTLEIEHLPELSSDLWWIHELSYDWSNNLLGVKTELIAALV